MSLNNYQNDQSDFHYEKADSLIILLNFIILTLSGSQMPHRQLLLQFIFILSCSLLAAQDCQSDIQMDSKLISRNKIKRVKILTADTASGKRKLDRDFFTDRNGKVYQARYYDNPDNNNEYIKQECTWSADSSEFVVAGSSVKKNGISVLSDKSVFTYNKKRELIRRTEEIWLPKHEYRIFRLNPQSKDEIESEFFSFNEGDTISYIREFNSKDISDKTRRIKIDGKWDEVRYVTQYVNGEVSSYKEFHNGKLITSLPKGEKENQPIADPEEIPEKVSFYEFTDTISIKVSPLKKYRISGISTVRSTKSFKQVTHYSDVEKRQISYRQYFYSNGLLLMSIEPGSGRIEVYEYDIYE